MTKNEKIIQAIFDAVDELNQLLPEKERLKKSVDTILFGESGNLDSLGFIDLVMETEQGIEEEFGVTITLFGDEEVISQKNNPFKTIGTFANHISLLLEEAS